VRQYAAAPMSAVSGMGLVAADAVTAGAGGEAVVSAIAGAGGARGGAVAGDGLVSAARNGFVQLVQRKVFPPAPSGNLNSVRQWGHDVRIGFALRGRAIELRFPPIV
jgi:hypothetical protein